MPSPEEQAFLDRCKAASAKADAGQLEGGAISDFPVDTKVIGEIVDIEAITSKKGGEFRIIHMKTTEGTIKFWSFGLLDYFLKKKSAAPGDLLVVVKHEKNAEGFWQGEFLCERADNNAES